MSNEETKQPEHPQTNEQNLQDKVDSLRETAKNMTPERLDRALKHVISALADAPDNEAELDQAKRDSERIDQVSSEYPSKADSD
jgi:hypothetical protein